MKNIFISLCFASFTYLVSSQNNSEFNVENQQLKFNLLVSPGLDYELGIAKNATVSFQLGTTLGAVVDDITDDIFLGLFPSVNTRYKYYYNFDRRLSKGKNIKGNSGNYISFKASYINSNAIIIADDVEIADDYYIELGAIYGFQRTYGKGFNIGFDVGLGYGLTDTSSGNIVPILDFSLGWVIL